MWHDQGEWVTCQQYSILLFAYKSLVHLKVDVPILTCIFFTFNWLTLTSEMHFVKFHPEVASLLSRGKRKYAPLGMRLLWKYLRNYFLVYQLTSYFLLYLQNYKEFEAEILDLQLEKYGLSFDIKKCTTSGWALGDENMIGISFFKMLHFDSNPSQWDIWLQRYEYFFKFKNNVKHKNLSPLLACNSKSIFPTSNSFPLIMSHIKHWTLSIFMWHEVHRNKNFLVQAKVLGLCLFVLTTSLCSCL